MENFKHKSTAQSVCHISVNQTVITQTAQPSAMKYETFVIKEANLLKQQTVYFFLKSKGISESYINKLRKKSGLILLNNTPANLKSSLKENDILQIAKDPSTKQTQFGNNSTAQSLQILFEDDDFLIVNKPHNLSCMPSRSHFNDNLGNLICQYMQKQNPNFVLRIFNRLDRETAGIVIIAKNLFSYNALQKHRKDVKKEYYALCYGNIKEKTITINQPILTRTENGINILKREISPKGKSATTHLKVVKNFENYCLAKFSLDTGRTHQIRVHTSYINHPLLGDRLYNSIQDCKNASHTMLLLKSISFQHFRTQKIIQIEIDFPQDWKQFLK